MNIFEYKLEAIMAKARSMYGQRLRSADYNNLLSCVGVQEIASYLRSRTDYAAAFEGVATAEINPGRLEYLVRKRAYDRFVKLCHYEKTFGEDFYRYFIVREEEKLILSCLRGILLGNTDRYILEMPAFYRKNLDIDPFALTNLKTVPELISALDGTPYKKVIEGCFVPGSTYLDYEISMMNYFYEYEYNLVKKSSFGRDREELLEILTLRADTQFICKAYRAKKYYPTSSQIIIRRMTPVHLTALSPKAIKDIINAADCDSITEALKKTKYKKYAEKIKSSDFTEQAVTAENYKKYRHALGFGKNPNAIMLCFIFLDDIEVQNIIRIIESVKYKADKETIKSLLIGTD